MCLFKSSGEVNWIKKENLYIQACQAYSLNPFETGNNDLPQGMFMMTDGLIASKKTILRSEVQAILEVMIS